MYNKELFEKYPYAFAHYAWTGKMYFDEETGEPHSEEVGLPEGWSELFWQCMEELREPLEKACQLDTFYFTQVKEKYGEMCLYNNGTTEEASAIISKYEYLSQFVCEKCGQPAEVQTDGWIGQYCKNCIKPELVAEQVKLNLHPKLIRYNKEGKTEIQLDYTDTWEKYLKRIKK